MALNTFEDLFIEELQDLYGAEHQLSEALVEMAEAADSKKLKKAFKDHLVVTKKQIKRLESIFEQMEKEPKQVKCKGMQGIIDEGKKLIKEKGDPAVKDAGLVAAAQRAEHYEIACYGTLRTFAELMGQSEIAEMLQETLDEESSTDELLTELATTAINAEAAEK